MLSSNGNNPIGNISRSERATYVPGRPQNAQNFLEGREVQNCELKKFSVFRDNFCFSKEHVERLPPLPDRHSGFCSVPRWIFWLNFWRPFFGDIYCSYSRKTHTENSVKISVEKFGEHIPFFGAFFGAFFGEQPFASKSEKFVQNPFCKRDPLRILVENAMHTRHKAEQEETKPTSEVQEKELSEPKRRICEYIKVANYPTKTIEADMPISGQREAAAASAGRSEHTCS